MHYLHAILVEIDDWFGDDLDEMEEYARTLAMDATEDYGNGNVFDWRTEEGAGRWSDEFPGKAVVLGAREKDKFIELLNEYKDMPLKEAISRLMWMHYKDMDWRTMSEINADPDLQVMENPRNGEDGKYWSARKLPPFEFTKECLEAAWSDDQYDMRNYVAAKICRLISSDYMESSHFFSVPDSSHKISKKTYQDAIENPERYALVFCDYHY